LFFVTIVYALSGYALWIKTALNTRKTQKVQPIAKNDNE